MTAQLPEHHFIHKSGWLRASVLGANDGIISTTSLAIGVAAGNVGTQALVLAVLAGLTAGAFSMAAGEYVSVSSQSDIEKADLLREEKELKVHPENELFELAQIYEARGLTPVLAMEVASQLTKSDALGAHARDELGISDLTTARPMQAALASGASFLVGALLPMVVALIVPIKQMIYWQYGMAIIFLALLGWVAARAGGSKPLASIIRVCVWGTIAMIMSALVGYLFGVTVA